MAQDKKSHRLQRQVSPSLQSWKKSQGPNVKAMKKNVSLRCGWGRLIFGQTFESEKDLAECLLQETPGKRDVALYIRDPHILLSLAPHKLFLDPSHTYRLWFNRYRQPTTHPKGFLIRRVQTLKDIKEINRIYLSCSMVPMDIDYVFEKRNSRTLTYLVVEDEKDNKILGTTMGVDHHFAFGDPEEGSSLWALAVDNQAGRPGVGQALVRFLVEHFMARGRTYLDVSVMHSNRQAIALYEKLGFQRVPAFCLKKKNPINEPLFIAPELKPSLNPYAEIIINEARLRGIDVDILDEKGGVFSLTFGGRTILCRESLSELTSAVSMSLCDDKALTHRVLKLAGLSVPHQQFAKKNQDDREFLKKNKRIVIKPVRGEQGAGVSVDIRSDLEMQRAIKEAESICSDVLLEEYIEGSDLRVIVIDFKVMAAATRVPPEIIGNDKHTIRQLIEKLNRRRMAATGGESKIPIDEETSRILKQKNYSLESVLPLNQKLTVRKAANLHTGGTIHDVTDQLHPKLIEACELAAKTLKIPVVGLDLMVPKLDGEKHVIIEANERPGLANHEPQPTAERFIDLLFPQSAGKILK